MCLCLFLVSPNLKILPKRDLGGLRIRVLDHSPTLRIRHFRSLCLLVSLPTLSRFISMQIVVIDCRSHLLLHTFLICSGHLLARLSAREARNRVQHRARGRHLPSPANSIEILNLRHPHLTTPTSRPLI